MISGVGYGLAAVIASFAAGRNFADRNGQGAWWAGAYAFVCAMQAWEAVFG